MRRREKEVRLELLQWRLEGTSKTPSNKCCSFFQSYAGISTAKRSFYLRIRSFKISNGTFQSRANPASETLASDPLSVVPPFRPQTSLVIIFRAAVSLYPVPYRTLHVLLQLLTSQMVAKRSLNLEGIYFVDEQINLAAEQEVEDVLAILESQLNIMESNELSDIPRPQHSSYNFDECYSDDSSSGCLDDEEGDDFYNSQQYNVSLQRLINTTLQQQSHHSTSHSTFGDLVDFDDNNSILTFHSFANAHSRGIRKWRSSGSVKSLFSDTSLQSRLSVTSDGELCSDEDETEHVDIFVELVQNLQM